MNNLGLSDRAFAEQNFSSFVDDPRCGLDPLDPIVNVSDASSFTENLAWNDEMYSDSDFDTTEFNREAGLSALGLMGNNGSSTSCFSCGGRMPMTPYSNFGSLCSSCANKKASNYAGGMVSQKTRINWTLPILLLIAVLAFIVYRKKKTA